MKILKITRNALLAACFLAWGQAATAGIISWDPADGEGDVGDDIIMDLVWTGETDEYLGDFDIQILWDETIAGLGNIEVDPDAGIDTLGCFLDGFSCDILGGAGDTSIFQVSFDDVDTLTGNQFELGFTFRIATFTFVGASAGVTDLTYGLTVFGDESGLPIQPTLQPGRICVGPEGCPVTEVSEPSTLALLGLGLIGAGFARRRRAAAA